MAKKLPNPTNCLQDANFWVRSIFKSLRRVVRTFADNCRIGLTFYMHSKVFKNSLPRWKVLHKRVYFFISMLQTFIRDINHLCALHVIFVVRVYVAQEYCTNSYSEMRRSFHQVKTWKVHMWLMALLRNFSPLQTIFNNFDVEGLISLFSTHVSRTSWHCDLCHFGLKVTNSKVEKPPVDYTTLLRPLPW